MCSGSENVKTLRCAQLAPELQQFFETAGPGVGAAVAERVARMADAVFPPQPDQDSAPLGVLNGALVSPRGAEVPTTVPCSGWPVRCCRPLLPSTTYQFCWSAV